MIEHNFSCPYCFESGLKLIDFSIKSQNLLKIVRHAVIQLNFMLNYKMELLQHLKL